MTVTGHTYTSTRVRGLAEWSPRSETLEVLNAVQDVLTEYRAYLPMTARQVFYRLVGAHDYDKTEKAYKRLLEYLNRARRAGMIPWSSIRDDGFASRQAGGWGSPQQFIDSMVNWAHDYERDHQEGQPLYTEIWVEAEGMMPQVGRMVSEFHIPIYSSGGFNSATAKYQTARRMMDRLRRDDRPTRVLHIGDYDPSGVAIIDSLADDIWQFLSDLAGGRTIAEFARVAVIPVQIDALGLIGAPAKATDRRAGFTDLAVQAEALAPPQLEAILVDAVTEEWDTTAHEATLELEAAEREQLIEALSGLEVT